MKEIILCKYGEIALKGANRNQFEKLLRDILKRRTEPYGKFKIYSVQSTVYIEPMEDGADVDGAYFAAKNTFGISAIRYLLTFAPQKESYFKPSKLSLLKIFGVRS